MGNWRLTAKQNSTSPHGGKNLKEGFTIVVGGQSTGKIGGPSMDEVRGALINVGFSLEEANKYVNSSPQNYFNCEYVGELDWDLVRAQQDALSSAKEEQRESEESEEEVAKKKADRKAKKDREESKKKSNKCCSCCCTGSICNSIIDSIPGLRCIVDCCC